MKIKNLVIGHSLSAILYSYYNKYHLIVNVGSPPFRFDEIDFVIPQFKESNKLKLWSKVLFEISLRGHAPFGEVENIRIKDNFCFVSCGPRTNIAVDFEKCFIFDDENVVCENTLLEKPKESFRVFDWISVRSCMPHGVEKITTGEKFVKEIYFYRSERIDGSHNKRDAVAVSFLLKEDLMNFDYSDTMAKFKVESLMKENGIVGRRNGHSKGGKEKRGNMVLEPSLREVVPVHKNKYENLQNVVFMSLTEQEVAERYA